MLEERFGCDGRRRRRNTRFRGPAQDGSPFDPDIGTPACGSFHHGSEPDVLTANALPSPRPPCQDGGTTTSGTCISSRLTPPWTPIWRNRFSPAIRSRIA